jgi:hypothetical protein
MLAFGVLDQIWLNVGCSGKYFEHGNHHSDCIRIWNFLDEMSECLFLNYNSAPSLFLSFLWGIETPELS